MTKIEIVSGFLGAGKTTLIKKLLKEAFSGEKLVLIENEFGEIGVDGGFLKEAGIEITEMNSGCICCSLVGDFGAALKEVLEKYNPDRVIIEPSGVGKLSDVVKAVEAVGEVVNSSVTVVDGQKCNMYMKNFGEFFNNQIENAGTIVISRTQKMKEDKLAKCVAQIREKNAHATVITTPWEEIDGKVIVNAMEHVALEMPEEHHHEHGEGCGCGCHDHGHHHHADEVFSSWGVETPRKYTEEEVQTILKELSDNDDCGIILRAKGIVPCTDGGWLHFDMVPEEYELRHGEADYTGRICVIGSFLDKEALKELFHL